MKFRNNKDNDKEENKFVQTLKKKWLINGTLTVLLVTIIISVFVGLNLFMQSLNLIPIDLSQDQLHTLSEDSKNKISQVNREVFLYFVGYPEDDSTVDLARQYTSSNKKLDWSIMPETFTPKT